MDRRHKRGAMKHLVLVLALLGCNDQRRGIVGTESVQTFGRTAVIVCRAGKWRTTTWRWTAPATGEVFTREGGLTPTCPPSADGVVPREGRA